MENILSKSFKELAIGFLITFGVGYYLQSNSQLLFNILDKVVILVILSLAIAFVMPIFLRKLSPLMIRVLYYLFAALEGVTFGAIFMSVKMPVIITAFLITSFILIVMSIIAKKYQGNLNEMGRIMPWLLIGVIVLSLLNIFIFKSSVVALLISIALIILFTGYILYDIKIISDTYPLMVRAGFNEDTLAVYGAFQLYLDLINIFIELINILSRTQNNNN